MLDSFVEELSVVGKNAPDSDKQIMKITYDFIKTMEFNKINFLKLDIEKEDQILRKTLKRAERKRKKEEKNKRKLEKKKLKEEKVENLEEGKIPENIHIDMEEYENEYDKEGDIDNLIDLSKFFDDKDMIPISNTDIERMIPYINMEENLSNSNANSNANNNVIANANSNSSLQYKEKNEKEFSEAKAISKYNQDISGINSNSNLNLNMNLNLNSNSQLNNLSRLNSPLPLASALPSGSAFASGNVSGLKNINKKENKKENEKENENKNESENKNKKKKMKFSEMVNQDLDGENNDLL